MNDRRARCGGSEWVMVAVLTVVVVCAAGCGKREGQGAARVETKEARGVSAQTGVSAADGVQGQSTSVGVAVAAFDTGLRAEEIMTELISRETTNGLDFASVSNVVAGIDSERIIRFCRDHLESRIYDNPRTIAIAQMYEVVLARGDVPSARLVALLELHHMYGGLNAGRVPPEWFEEKSRLYDEARLSAQPTEAERTAFATIQLSMLTRDEEPAEKLARVRRVKEMCARGEISFSKQILDMMERTEIGALLKLKRADEAYALMKESFAKRDRGELDSSVWPRKYYGDFESSFQSFSNTYYGDPIRQISKELNERRGMINWDASPRE